VTESHEPASPAVDDERRPSAGAPPTPPETTPAASLPLASLVREHPWITAIMLVCTVGGALAGPSLFDEDWSLLRQLAAGAFCGAWVGLTLTVTKMIGD